LPTLYVDVLENTQYALIATVKRLYIMVRNKESWKLENPGMNACGEPMIHDIASKLGCIRASTDLTNASLRKGFTEFEGLPQTTHSKSRSRDSSEPSTTPDCINLVVNCESENSNFTHICSQEQQAGVGVSATAVKGTAFNSDALKLAAVNLSGISSDNDHNYWTPGPFDTTHSVASQTNIEAHILSPIFQNTPPFAPWTAGDDLSFHAPISTSSNSSNTPSIPGYHKTTGVVNGHALGSDALNVMRIDSLNFAEGTIRPELLDWNRNFRLIE